MKLLGLIFSFYFLALAVMPCSDEISLDNCKTVLEHSHYSPEHSDHETDLCTPFCTCNCCGGITFVIQKDFKLASFIFPKQKSIYAVQFPSEISYSFWQPPKV